MSNVKFTEEHEWIAVEGDICTCGITDYAQNALGDVVYVELPEVGRQVELNEEIAVVESVKAASEIFAPVSGEVIAVNEALVDAPETVNQTPEGLGEGEGWFFKIKLNDASQLAALMDRAAYDELISD